MAKEAHCVPIEPICRPGFTKDDCKAFAELVHYVTIRLQKGQRVVVHCRQGLHRTGIAIFLLLRAAVGDDAKSDEECLEIMATMRRPMLQATYSDLYAEAKDIFAAKKFQMELQP